MIVDDNADARDRLAQQLASDVVKRFCAPSGRPPPVERDAIS
jgi:hypothetical protein